MTNRVVYSAYCWVLSALCVLLIGGYGGMCFYNDNPEKGWVMIGMLVCLIIPTLIYAPLAISVDEEYIAVRRPLATKRIPLQAIAAMSYAPPTMGEKRIIASGGFMGYWGWFKDWEAGKYFGYYGRASETFLLKLRNGKQYMLGCKDCATFAEEVKRQIENLNKRNR